MPEGTPPAKPSLTPDQRRGVETVGRSLLLSAAAGSGKTRVLAERCAYLVCDAPPPYRCDVTELLVVTFTEASAAEMRERIGRTLQSRVHNCPDSRLQTQAALLEQAQISTLHGFCTTLLRQHFHLVGLDPAFSVMDEYEGKLLRLDVGRDLIRRRYETDQQQSLSRLLDGYYDGEDERLLSEILRVHEMLQSLIDPEAWIRQSLDKTEQAAKYPLAKHPLGHELLALIRRRIIGLGGRCNLALASMRKLGRFEPYEDQIVGILQIYRHLFKQLQTRSVDVVAEELAGVEKLPNLKPVRATVPNKDQAKALVDAVAEEFKNGSWRTLLKSTEAQWRDGMTRVVPYARELLELVAEFGREYRRVKDESRQLDFNDLEHFSLKVLRDSTQPGLVASSAARYYQRLFKHVLVDEYQDINELQNAILSLVSAEARDEPGASGAEAPHRPSLPSNFFCVGDVKQSIYRFRLADPKQFLAREAALRGAGSAGEVIDLRQNFRSRGPLLEAINRVFERLMTRSAVEIEYDQTQRLAAGRVFPDADDARVFSGAPIELHVLPRDAGDGDTPEQAVEEWDRTEREAALAARRILEIVGRAGQAAMRVYDRQGTVPRPATFGDIVVLLRTRKFKAGQFVRIFERFGIPTHAESGSGFFESTEIRDMLALLGLLDNQAQDFELAAFLRSPLARMENVEDALATAVVAYRQSAPPIPFHEAVARYATEKTDAVAADLRSRLEWLADLRHQANRQPVHETIWAVYQQSGYLAYVAGLPGGQQRSANLIELYDRARSFGTHRRQDLGRFLEFLRTLEAEADLGQPSVASEAEDVVRILTVHGAKGLEFPIVIVPDFGKAINTFDAAGAVVVDRTHGLGMKVVNEELFARYPSVGQLVVEDQLKKSLMAEELRVLYVAMTRAMEHLVLIGTTDGRSVDGWEKRWTGHSGPLPDADILGAGSMLAWLGPVWAADHAENQPTLELIRHSLAELHDPRSPGATHDVSRLVQAVQTLRPLDATPVLSPEGAKVVARLEYAYPFEAQSARAAVSSVTAMAKGQTPKTLPAAPSTDIVNTERSDRLALPAFMSAGESVAAAADKGTATHTVLQHLRFIEAGNRSQIEAQVDRMVAEGRLTETDRGLVDVATIEWFVGTELGMLLRTNEGRLMREMPVYFAVSPQDESVRSADSIEPSGLDSMMVRGRLDLFIPLPNGGVLVDYKTDNVRSAELIESRKQTYEPQMRAYGDAIARITGVPVARRYLVFLTPRRVEEV
ncbi:helicase-exonuclease AddAB subunit AddA [Humisphaera borealis]|uniref:DNA 3'-5' helicase n=1 Tax=Humisphaera borealis TaxID=2807512 RepID=A0A7M2X0X8_9BACT|nr:helicase-exonuclease AddAB subunit AddA [Humisphaera borealis]QOV91396.1 helicase-exonuclease AddAB subunit AddA [Humisphaera borealis]